MSTGILDIRKGGRPLAAVAVMIFVIMLVMTFVFPDDNGKIRTDLEVGDFFTLENETMDVQIRYEITGIDGDNLTVKRSVSDGQESTYNSDSRAFLSHILFDYESLQDDSTISGISVIKTFHGQVLCDVYHYKLNTYYVDEYGVIYHSTIGGASLQLVETSLLIGYENKGGLYSD